jgi:hypothetical protein
MSMKTMYSSSHWDQSPQEVHGAASSDYRPLVHTTETDKDLNLDLDMRLINQQAALVFKYCSYWLHCLFETTRRFSVPLLLSVVCGDMRYIYIWYNHGQKQTENH